MSRHTPAMSNFAMIAICWVEVQRTESSRCAIAVSVVLEHQGRREVSLR